MTDEAKKGKGSPGAGARRKGLSARFILLLVLLIATSAYALLISAEGATPARSIFLYQGAGPSAGPAAPQEPIFRAAGADIEQAARSPEPGFPSARSALKAGGTGVARRSARLLPAPGGRYAGAGEPARAAAGVPERAVRAGESWQGSEPLGFPSAAQAARPERESPSAPSVVAPGAPSAPEGGGPTWGAGSFRSVRFDAGYYYGKASSVQALVKKLVDSWGEKGINVVYFYAYNRIYGARYRTKYQHNIMEDFGRLDLLGELIPAAHARGIKVIAWFYGAQHKQAWEAHPGWREKVQEGGDYRPTADSYFLCVRNPEVRSWWKGFLEDLLDHYPALDGIDMAEAQVDLWGDQACYCELCRSSFKEQHPGRAAPGPEWRRHRAQALTDFLLATNRLAHSRGAEAHLTTILTANRQGELLSSEVVRDVTGVDLEALLGAGKDRPDVVQAELIWQQWASAYQDKKTFSPAWTERAVQAAHRLIAGRAKLVAHVELTDFGAGSLDAGRLRETVLAALAGRAWGVDIYDTNQLDRTEDAARQLRLAWLPAGG